MGFCEVVIAAKQKHASDIHIACDTRMKARINGELVDFGTESIEEDIIHRSIQEMLTEQQKELFKSNGEVDFSFSAEGNIRVRGNAFLQGNRPAVSLRLLENDIPSPEDLMVPKSVVDMVNRRRGLILVTGPTGSGKSTTLASLINLVTKQHAKKVITLEDPIEYMFQNHKSLVSQREIGRDTMSYAAGLRAALRQDPDVILVGEMRDYETIAIALTAAETGHLVFSTLHTNSAADTIDRIIDVFPTYQQQQIRTQLAEVLECVVVQQLMKRSDKEGRLAAFEVMLGTTAIKSLIREQKTYQIPGIIQTSGKIGMNTMDDCIRKLYGEMKITAETAVNHAMDQDAMQKEVRKW